ncbi:MAG: YicC family protein [Nitrospira sp.]|nr:YicC family protein [Nitrospira sp.]
MIQSMTGFGSSKGKYHGINYKVEIRSVNHRYCDITVRFPDELGRLEHLVRTEIANAFARGKFEVNLFIGNNTSEDEDPELNISLVNRYKAVLRTASEAFNTDFSIDNKLSLSDLHILTEKVYFKKMDYNSRKADEFLMNLFKEAIKDLGKMRLREGEIICRDIKKRISKLQAMIKKIKRHIPPVISQMKKKYVEKIREIAGTITLDMNRIHQEIAMIVERMDVEEEIVRLGSHITQLNEKLNKGGVAGRGLDFLLQEVNREINTIGSKSSDSKISETVIDMKADVERIREQVANIE